METAITALIILTVVLFGALTLAQVYLSSQDAILESWREMEERLGERARTDISFVGATTNPTSSKPMTVTLKNKGSTKLADFDRWDVILQYESIRPNDWCHYDDDPKKQCYWIKKIYLDGGSEIFEPGILNPNEEMTITITITSAVEITPTWAIIATPNGVSDEAFFTRKQ